MAMPTWATTETPVIIKAKVQYDSRGYEIRKAVKSVRLTGVRRTAVITNERVRYTYENDK